MVPKLFCSAAHFLGSTNHSDSWDGLIVQKKALDQFFAVSAKYTATILSAFCVLLKPCRHVKKNLKNNVFNMSWFFYYTPSPPFISNNINTFVMIVMACGHLPLTTQCRTEHKAGWALTFNVLFFWAHQEGDSNQKSSGLFTKSW